jgi:dTDP-4-dehydrorhamnose reductase
MKILIFGKDGQLGKAFQEECHRLSIDSENQIRYIGRADCDLSEEAQLDTLLINDAPDCIINAAAYTAVDKAEQEPELAFAINAKAPQRMAYYAAQHGATLLHFSTDYVFDGLEQGVYCEGDVTNPLGVYGASKMAGENAIEKTFTGASGGGLYAILRTSWVYGDGGNFIQTILRLAKERTTLRVIDNQYGVPTSALWLAELSLGLVLDSGQRRSFQSGIYHAVPRGETNWHQLACLAVQTAIQAGHSLALNPAAIVPIPASEYPLPAPRPMNSRLSTAKLQSELERLGLVSKLPHWNTPWDEQVADYVKQISKN